MDIASLIEQTGRPSVPHVSEATYNLLQNRLSLSFMPSHDVVAFGKTIKTYEMLVLDEENDALERLAARLRVPESDLVSQNASGSKPGSGEAFTAAAVRQAIGASGPLAFSDVASAADKRRQLSRSTLAAPMKNFDKSINRISCELY